MEGKTIIFGRRNKSSGYNEPAQRMYNQGMALGFLSSLRRRLDPESNLLPAINDFSLLLRLEDKEYKPIDAEFDLLKLADKVLLSVKRLEDSPAGQRIMLSVSSGIHAKRYGPAELIDALLRNLLLVALKNSTDEMICLRLEEAEDEFHEKIYFSVQNTASNNKLLNSIDSPADNNSGSAIDISWPLLANVISRLGGFIEIYDGSFHGHFPLKQISGKSKIAPRIMNKKKPLVMIVEDDRTNHFMQKNIFKEAGYDVFGVSNGAEAIEWAPVLPLSLITVDSVMPGMPGHMVAARFSRMKKEGLLSGDVAVIAISANDSPHDRNIWKQAGVENLLLKPLRAENLHNLSFSVPDHKDFYLEKDVPLSGEDLRSLDSAEIQGQFREQIISFCNLLEKKPDKIALAHASHAIKSASLALGYFRLSGLAAAIEHKLYEEEDFTNENNTIIKQLLAKAFV